MDDCGHCRALRSKLEEIRDRHGLDIVPRWGEVVAFDSDLTKELHPLAASTNGQTKCTCRCHIPARISGRLPALT